MVDLYAVIETAENVYIVMELVEVNTYMKRFRVCAFLILSALTGWRAV